jgi:cyclopropane-fatty-acyl-phospholipid synthase
MDHVCRKLRLRADERVVEAGCGWGAFALRAATRWGARVRAFNISSEQIAYARERARRLGVQDRVEFIEDDYRNATGRCDAFVSIGMLEHVGPEHYRDLGGIIDRCLGPT